MRYENYVEFISALTYNDYLRYKIGFFLIISGALLIFLEAIRQTIIYRKFKTDKTTEKKLKYIAKREKRPLHEQMKLIINEYIETYLKKHGIEWDSFSIDDIKKQ